MGRDPSTMRGRLNWINQLDLCFVGCFPLNYSSYYSRFNGRTGCCDAAEPCRLPLPLHVWDGHGFANWRACTRRIPRWVTETWVSERTVWPKSSRRGVVGRGWCLPLRHPPRHVSSSWRCDDAAHLVATWCWPVWFAPVPGRCCCQRMCPWEWASHWWMLEPWVVHVFVPPVK